MGRGDGVVFGTPCGTSSRSATADCIGRFLVGGVGLVAAMWLICRDSLERGGQVWGCATVSRGDVNGGAYKPELLDIVSSPPWSAGCARKIFELAGEGGRRQ